MEQPEQVRVTGPSRALLALATGVLVTVTSAATAFVVLQGTAAVVGPTPELAPLPPAVAAPVERPVVVLPPGALGTGRSAISTGAPRLSRATSTGSAASSSASATSSLALSLRATRDVPTTGSGVAAPVDAPLAGTPIDGRTDGRPADGGSAPDAAPRPDDLAPDLPDVPDAPDAPADREVRGGRGDLREERRTARAASREAEVLSPLTHERATSAGRLSALLDRRAVEDEKRDAGAYRAEVRRTGPDAGAAGPARAVDAAAGQARAQSSTAQSSSAQQVRARGLARAAEAHTAAERRAAERAPAAHQARAEADHEPPTTAKATTKDNGKGKGKAKGKAKRKAGASARASDKREAGSRRGAGASHR